MREGNVNILSKKKNPKESNVSMIITPHNLKQFKSLIYVSVCFVLFLYLRMIPLFIGVNIVFVLVGYLLTCVRSLLLSAVTIRRSL